jgi:hypothetical protein
MSYPLAEGSFVIKDGKARINFKHDYQTFNDRVPDPSDNLVSAAVNRITKLVENQNKPIQSS